MNTLTSELTYAEEKLEQAQGYGDPWEILFWGVKVAIIRARLQRLQDADDHDAMRDLLAGPRA